MSCFLPNLQVRTRTCMKHFGLLYFGLGYERIGKSKKSIYGLEAASGQEQPSPILTT
jgi:hypothetical protein